MRQITQYNQWLDVVQKHGQLLLFVKTANCSVCEGLYPQIEPLEAEGNIPFFAADASKLPELAGQLGLFTAPVVILMNDGREYARYARFVPVEEVKQKLQELKKWEESYD